MLGKSGNRAVTREAPVLVCVDPSRVIAPTSEWSRSGPFRGLFWDPLIPPGCVWWEGSDSLWLSRTSALTEQNSLIPPLESGFRAENESGIVVITSIIP